MAEYLKIEIVRRRRCPKSKSIDGLSPKTDHRSIKGDPDQFRGPPTLDTQAPAGHFERAVQRNFDPFVGPGDLPGIRATEPVVGLFLLPTILDGLFEHPILV